MQQISLPKATLEEESKGSITTWKEKEIDFTMIIKKTCIKGRRLEASLNSCEGCRVYQEYWTQWGQTLSILILKFVFAAWRWKASNYHGVDKYWDKKNISTWLEWWVDSIKEYIKSTKDENPFLFWSYFPENEFFSRVCLILWC
jgi:hypothetical protein